MTATVTAAPPRWRTGLREVGRYLRRNPALDRTVDLPVATPTCPCFGGPTLTDLYVTSMGEARDAPCGALLVVRGLGVRGLPEPPFEG